jgi:replication-associated recombination protein RarA
MTALREECVSDYYEPFALTKTRHGLEGDLILSALQKSIRKADESLAVRLAYECYVTSTQFEEKMWNRLLVISVEDIGFANTDAPAYVKTLNALRKEFPYGDGDRPIFFIQAIRYLCQSKKERSSDQIKNIIMKEFERGIIPEIPDYAADMHTLKGRALGRDVFQFLDEGSTVTPLWEKYDDRYWKQLRDMCVEEQKSQKPVK